MAFLTFLASAVIILGTWVVATSSTESGVFCTAMIVSAAAPISGIDLHMVRFNPNPGAVE